MEVSSSFETDRLKVDDSVETDDFSNASVFPPRSFDPPIWISLALVASSIAGVTLDSVPGLTHTFSSVVSQREDTVYEVGTGRTITAKEAHEKAIAAMFKAEQKWEAAAKAEAQFYDSLLGEDDT